MHSKKIMKPIATTVLSLAILMNGISVSTDSLSPLTYSDSITLTANAYDTTRQYKDTTGKFYVNLDNSNGTGSTSCSIVKPVSNTTATVTIPNTLTVKGTNSKNESFTVTVAVKEIRGRAFANNTTLTTLNLNTNLEEIGNSAFSGCTALETVKFTGTPKLKTIGNSAFYGCTKLNMMEAPSEYKNPQQDSLYIPKSVTYLGGTAFYKCSKIKRVYLNENMSLKQSSTINVFPYNNLDFKLFMTNEANITAVSDPKYGTGTPGTSNETATVNGVIYTYNFADPSDITAGIVISNISSSEKSVLIPQELKIGSTSYNVTYIGDGVLQANEEVTSVTFPSTVKNIGAFVCADCPNLKTVNLPSSLQSIGYASFYSNNITKVTCSSKTLTSVGECAFSTSKWTDNHKTTYRNAEALMLGNFMLKYYGPREKKPEQSSSIKESKQTPRDFNAANGVYATDSNDVTTVTAIGNNAFGDNSNLFNVSLKNVKTLGDNAFAGCQNLQSVNDTESLDKIGINAFHPNTYKKLAETTTNKNYIMLGNTLIKWLNTSTTTADLTSLTNLKVIARGAFDGTAVTRLNLPAYNKSTTDLHFGERAFINSKIHRIYVGGYIMNYTNYKNGTGTIKAFYDRNVEGLEGSKAAYQYILIPVCSSILQSLGIQEYPSNASSMTTHKQMQIASTLYRYCTSKFYYDEMPGDNGENTLINNIGVCRHQAYAYAALLKQAGIKSVIAEVPGHAWNMVKIGNKWFHCDPTWGGVNGGSQGGVQSWFMRTTSEIETMDSLYHKTPENEFYEDYYRNDPMAKAYGIVYPTENITCNTIIGDINKDEKLNSTDISRLTAYIDHDVSGDVSYADFNGDLKVDQIDLMWLEARVAENTRSGLYK